MDTATTARCYTVATCCLMESASFATHHDERDDRARSRSLHFPSTNSDAPDLVKMYKPLFSASYSDRFDVHRIQEATRKRPLAHWRRGYMKDGLNTPLGYYLEPAPPSPDSASSSSRPTTPDATDVNREIVHGGVSPPSKPGSHGFSVYIHKLQVILPRIPFLSPRQPRRMAATPRRTPLWVSFWCVSMVLSYSCSVGNAFRSACGH